MPRPYTTRDTARLEHAAAEYRDMASAATPRYALRTAFDYARFRIADYCAGFRPNPAARETEEKVRTWAQEFGLWIPDVTEHCNDLASYLYPEAPADRLATIGKNFAIDWYINDTIGRERVAGLAPEGKRAAALTREHLLQVSRTLQTGPDAAPVDHACLDMLQELRAGSNNAPQWYTHFLSVWTGHLRTMGHDGNASAGGTVPTAAEYLQTRIDISGMPHTIALGEFATDTYLNWVALDRDALAARRLRWLCAAIGCLSNDLFSFEKEFIRHRSDSNLIPVLLLNHPHLTLDDAVVRAITRVRKHTVEYIRCARSLTSRANELPQPLCMPLQEFVRATESCVKATWTWQLLSQRYRFPGSIFEETRPGWTAATDLGSSG
ncbi:terpene synthase family protein [Kitasatospora sp. NPDC059571]|uniref:terpene synthase family protein n=1 Tax=Kitasatospora sp. NPDC059571 TaxID=3346871 RepID=UPI00367904BF